MRPVAGRGRCGFTLIEVLVVISVVVLLVGILLPALGAARDAARAVKCASNLRQMGIAGELYASAFREVILPSFYDEWLWNDVLFDGSQPMSNGGLMPDPMGRSNARYRQGGMWIHQCPDNPFRTNRWCDTSYAVNFALSAWHSDPFHEVGSQGNPGPRWIRASRLATPSRIIQLADAPIAGLSGDPDEQHRPTHRLTRFDAVGFDWHRDRAGLLLLDGHAEGLSQGAYDQRYQAMTLLWRRQHVYWW